MRRWMPALLLALLLLPARPAAAPAQVKEAMIGGVTGVAAGLAITTAIVVARARFQEEYLDSPHDLIHWQTTPLIAAPATGAFFGLTGAKILRGSIVGSGTGMAVGALTGAGVAVLTSSDPESRWAGGVIGGGLGLTVGGLLGAYLAWREHGGDDPDPDAPAEALRLGIQIPL